MLYTLQSASANHVPSANSLSDARKSAQLITATRSVMKTLADFSALETATGLAAEAFAVFRSKSTMDANGLNGALLSQAVQTGYFQVIQSVLANANESTLAKNGTTVIDLLSLATLYIENFLKSDSAIISTQDYATSQEAFKRIFLIYLHCIPLSTAAATISTDQDLKYSAEGAVAFLQKLKEKGYLPELSEYNSLMSLLSKSVIPAPKTLVTFEWPNSQVLPRSKRISHLQQLLQSLQLSGLKPTALTYTHLFNACSADFKHRVPDDWFKSLLFQIKRSNNNSNNNNTKRGSIPHTYGSTKSVLRLHLQRGQTDAFVNLWTEMRNNHSKNINKNHIDGVPPRQWESMVQKTTREIYNIVLKTASSQTSMGAKRFCGWIVTDFMYEMDRDQTVRDDDTWYYLVKCCLVAQDLVNARGIVAAMKEERALQREGGVGGGEKDDLLKASDARIYAVLVRLTFMDSCTAQLFGRDLMLEMHKSGVFGGAIRWEVMRLAIDFYVRAEENRRLLDDDLMESLLELTDFKGIADLGKEIKMKLLEARDSAKR
ncbi:hypothetical protein BDR26DRAFT_872610 [Obelidium mucronatum]|nr:hypothetical protein BDR26DRAFT_872610 [Obelidium mucronatum]